MSAHELAEKIAEIFASNAPYSECVVIAADLLNKWRSGEI